MDLWPPTLARGGQTRQGNWCGVVWCGGFKYVSEIWLTYFNSLSNSEHLDYTWATAQKPVDHSRRGWDQTIARVGQPTPLPCSWEKSRLLGESRIAVPLLTSAAFAPLPGMALLHVIME